MYLLRGVDLWGLQESHVVEDKYGFF